MESVDDEFLIGTRDDRWTGTWNRSSCSSHVALIAIDSSPFSTVKDALIRPSIVLSLIESFKFPTCTLLLHRRNQEQIVEVCFINNSVKLRWCGQIRRMINCREMREKLFTDCDSELFRLVVEICRQFRVAVRKSLRPTDEVSFFDSNFSN